MSADPVFPIYENAQGLALCPSCEEQSLEYDEMFNFWQCGHCLASFIQKDGLLQLPDTLE